MTVVNQKTKWIRSASLPAGGGSHGTSHATAPVIAAAISPSRISWTTEPRRTASEPYWNGIVACPVTLFAASPFHQCPRVGDQRETEPPKEVFEDGYRCQPDSDRGRRDPRLCRRCDGVRRRDHDDRVDPH